MDKGIDSCNCQIRGILNMNYKLPELIVAEFVFTLTAKYACELRAYKGSMLRGAFGMALRNTVCIMSPQQACSDCMIRSQCANTRLFETIMQKEPPRFLKNMDMAPKPFVLYCDDEQIAYEPGEPLTFSMKLIGSAIDFYPYVIHAVQRMAAFGFTRKKAAFDLVTVAMVQPDGQLLQIYDGAAQKLFTRIETRKVPELQNAPASSADSVLLEFVSPTRFKVNKRYSADFTFRQLVFVMLRRHLELVHFYGNADDIDWEFHDLLVAADEIHMSEIKLNWLDHHRYSNRQRQDMMMGGVVGTIRLKGDLSIFYPLLQSAAVMHVGKGTTFGLGRIEIR